MLEYKAYTDQQLVVLLKEGKQGAFTEIYDRYWALMYIHVYKMLRDKEETKDLLQDVFSSLWLKSSELKVETKLSGHLYLSARNRVFNLIQRNKVKSDYLGSIAMFLSEAGTETMEKLNEKDLINVIESEIKNLPEKMREIFELSRKKNLTHKQIAEKLNLSDQTVRKQVQNALRILRLKLNSLGVGAFCLLFLR